MDLSKAFDYMPHKLLIAKFKAYGLDYLSIQQVTSYLEGGKQRVRVGNEKSEWADIIKGVPQRSILGPIFFNIFINDMFYSIKKAELNYADDNTVITVQPTQKLVVDLLQAESRVAITWFTLNQMLGSPEKFQAIFINCAENDIEIEIDGIKLSSEDHVKLLRVNLDSKLNFEIHIQQICFKAGNHLNVLKRLSTFIHCKDRMAISRSLILCHFEFCSVVWHFCGKTSIRRMEKIQERALRFVYRDYDTTYHDDLLHKAKLPTLELGRERSIAILTYKILHDQAPNYLKDLINCNRNSKLYLPSHKSTKHGINYFSNLAPRIWNSLPETTRNAPSPQFQDSHKEMEWATRKQVWLLLGGPVENGFDNL